MKKNSEQHIITSWKKNIQPWVEALHNGKIKSRVLVTNKAIVDAVSSRNPLNILDVGCGEGWLVRAVSRIGIKGLGIDIFPNFVNIAKKEGSGKFRTMPYEEVSLNTIAEKFAVIVCNFSLLGDKSVQHIFKQAPFLLQENGAFIVQTIHPVEGCGKCKYEDGWREGNWIGFSENFVDPAPWYFRTLENWKSLFLINGFKLVDILEPLNPKTNKPASIHR